MEKNNINLIITDDPRLNINKSKTSKGFSKLPFKVLPINETKVISSTDIKVPKIIFINHQ